MGHNEKEQANSTKWSGFYLCDDLVPPLCDDDLTVTIGSVETLEGVNVTYWRYTPSLLIPTKFPIVVINGGPGLPHNYVKPTRNLACDGREVVLYDQAGTGASQLSPEQSENALELYPELFTIEYYANIELPSLIQALEWQKYHILGTSWGTQIAFQFAVSDQDGKHKNGLQSLLMNAPIADNQKFIEYQWDPVDGSIGSLPTYVQERLEYFNRTQDFGNEEYQFLQSGVLNIFNARLGVLIDCWTETVDAGISTLDLSRMIGDSDIFLPPLNATMRGWSVLPQLHTLHSIPVQLNYGTYGMVSPRLVADTAAALSNGGDYSMVECHRLPRAAHSLLLDSPDEAYPKIRDFLLRVEVSSATGYAFQAHGECPTSQISSSPMPLEPKDPFIFSNMMWFLALVWSLAAAFKVGLWVGARQTARQTGYEQV